MEVRILVLLLCTAGSLAAPTDVGKCASECVPVYNQKFNYAVGKVYAYNYESSTTLSLPGGAVEEPGLKLKALAEFHVISQCEFLLKLTNVQLDGASVAIPNAPVFKQAVEEKTLLFSYTDGRVDHICPDPKEKIWALNVKRAVLSAFQNTMDNGLESHVREVDVIGQCDTHYTVMKNDKNNPEVHKSKNVISCTNRLGNHTALQATPYVSRSDVQSFPVLKSTHECHHIFGDSILKSAVCDEVHKLRIFAKGDHGTTTKTSTKLTYSKSGKSNIKNFPRKFEQASLLFDHDHDHDDDVKSDLKETTNVLRELCTKSSDGDIPKDAANRFTRLVYLLRRLSTSELQSLPQKLESCAPTKAKDTFYSALLAAGTEATTKAVVEILNSGKLTKLRTRLWESSFAFISHPTTGTIDTLLTYGQAHPDRITTLALSSLVHTYCRHHSHCEKEPVIQKVIDALGSQIAPGKVTDTASEDRYVIVLKAFGNIGHVGSHADEILALAKDTKLPIPVRLAAIEAFRRAPPAENVLRALVHLLEDNHQSVEVRIASYLALVHHPYPQLFQKVKDILEVEVINQVNTFIWSHIKNLKETLDPLKRDLKWLVRGTHLNKRFEKDPRKYSRNYEASFLNDRINVGYSVDSNVVFSPESFLPRSASLNFSVDVFGSSFDLFEVDVRAEHFEHLLESYFGPVGSLSQTTKEEVKSKLMDRWRKISQGIENEVTGGGGQHQHHHRRRRELPYKPQKLKRLQEKAGFRPVTTPEGSLSLRIFGNELRFYNFHKLDDIYDKEDPYNLQDVFNKLATHKELDVARNWMLVDSQFEVPTAMGFPLRLDLNATISLGLKLNSHFDVRSLLLRPRECDIKSLIQPSANLELAAALLIDAHVTKTGFKVASTLYTAPAIDGTVLLKQGESFTVKVDLPKPKFNLYNFKVQNYVVKGDSDISVTPVVKDRYEISACSSRLADRLGLEICTKISASKPLYSKDRPHFPLSGNYEHDVTLRKVEEGLQGYHFTALWKQDKGANDEVKNTELKLSFNTPGSTKDREYTVDYQLDRGNKKLRTVIHTPRNKISLVGDFVGGPSSYEGKMTLNVNGDREYSFSGKTEVVKQGETTVYKPVWEITRPDSPKTTLVGTITRTPGKKIEFDLKSDAGSTKKVVVKGFAQKEGTIGRHDNFKVASEFEIDLPYLETKFGGSFENHFEDGEEKHDLEIHGAYQLQPNGEKRGLTFKLLRETKLDTPLEYKIRRKIEWTTIRFPEFNGKVDFCVEKVDHEYHNLLDVKWGPNFEDASKKLFFEHTHNMKRVSKAAYEGQGSLKFIYPRRNINWDLTSKLQYQPNKLFDYESTLKYSGDKTLKVTLNYKNQTSRAFKYFFEATVTLPTREIIYRESVEEKGKGEYQGTVFLQWQKGEFANSVSTYKNKGTTGIKHHELDVVVTYKNDPKPIRKYNVVLHAQEGKYSAIGKAELPDTTYVVDGQYTRPDTSNANLKLVVRLPWIEGQVKSKRTPGEFDGQFDFKTEKRAANGAAVLKGSGINKVLTADLKWDVGRDDSKKLSLKANIVRPRDRAAEVKATLDLPSRDIKANIKYELPEVIFNGAHLVDVDVEYAPGKKVTVHADITVDKSSAGRRQSHGQVAFSSPSVEKVKVTYDTDFRRLTDQKSFKGSFKIETVKFEDISIEIDHMRGYKELKSSVEASYAGDRTLRLGVGAYYDLTGSHGGPGFDVGGSIQIKTPLQGLQDVELTIREGYSRSYVFTNIVHENHVRWAPEKEAGLAFEWRRKYTPGEGFEVLQRFQLDTPLEHLRTQKLQTDLAFHRSPNPNLSGNLDAIWGDGKKVKSILRYNRDDAHIEARLSVDASDIKTPGTLDIKFSNEQTGPESYLAKASVVVGDKTASVVHKLQWTPTKRSVDLVIALPIQPSEITLKGIVNVQGTKRDVDVNIRWTPDGAATVKGQVTLGESGSFNSDLTIDSAKLGLSGVKFNVRREAGGPKRAYGIKVSFGPEREFDASLNVNDKPDKTGSTGDGVLKINGEDFITAKLDVLDAKTNKNSHGRLLGYSAQVTNPVISFKASAHFLTEKGINPNIRICTMEGEKCLYLEGLFDPQYLDTKLGPIDNNFYIKFGAQKGPGDSRTLGFIARTNRVRNIFEHSFKFAWDEEHNRVIGYTYKSEVSFDQSKPGSRRTYQVVTPSRTIELRTEREETKAGYTYNGKFLLDAVRDPNRMLTVSVDAKNSTDGTTYTRNARVTIKHPDLSKELVITSEVKSRSSKFLYSRKMEFDLSSDARKKFTLDYSISDEAKTGDGHNYTLFFNIRQLTFKNLDFRIKGHSADVGDEHTGGAEFYWLSKSGQPKTISFFHHRDYAHKHVHGVIQTPVRKFEWEGTYERLDDAGLPAVRTNLDFKYNGKLIRRAAIEYSRRPEFNIKYFVNPEDKTRLFRLHGGVLDDTTFRLTATRIRSGQETQDVDILVKLNNTQLLFNRIKWRPGILQDLQHGIDARLESMSGEFDGVIQNFVTTAKEEVVDKTEVIRDVFKTELLPLSNNLKQKLVKIVGELQGDLKGTKLEYLNDVLQHLFGNFIDVDQLMESIESVREKLQLVFAKGILKLFDFLDKLLEKAKTLPTLIGDRLSDLPEKVKVWRANLRAKLPEIAERIKKVLDRVRDFLADVVENQYLTKFLEKFRTIWDELVGRVKAFVDAILANIFGSSDGKPSLYERIKTRLYEYSEREGEFPKVVKGILTTIRTIKEKIIEICEDVRENIRQYREEIRDQFSDMQKQLMANPDYRALVEEIRAHRQELHDKYAKGDVSLKQRIRDAVDKALGLTREKLQAYIDAYVFDLKNGRVEFYVPLPLPVESLRTLPQAFQFRRLLERDGNSWVHAYHRYKPYLTLRPRDLLPPFEAHAMLIGNQHYMTFDKRFYDFAGKCQYVLTHDFVDQNFSVIVNYASSKGKPVKSSIIVVSDSHHVEIRPDFKVLLDEQLVELPIQIENTIIRQQWHNVRVDNNKGFTLFYDFAHDILSVNISGWYFGRVGGLLGTYNYEPSDDLRNPEGQNLTSVTLFANSWEVSNDCPSTDNLASHEEAYSGSKAYDVCYKLFQSEFSPFHDCFHHLNPESFFRVCVEEAGIHPDADLADNVCRASAAYHHACEHKNVHLEMPEKCIRCKTPSGENFIQGETHILKDADIPKSADVVLVIEQKECNRRILMDSLDEVAKDLDKELQAAGYQNNRYGIVGFGGEGIQERPHSHTAKGQVFTDANSVKLTLKNMVFSSSNPSDTFGAIDLAADYPFRAGVAKIGLIFLCNRCVESSMSVKYPELQKRLLEAGFTIHALTPEEIEMKTKPQIAKQLIGIDAVTTYKTKDISQKELTGEADLRPHITGAKDICFVLAQELNGTVFRSDQFGVRKGNVGKNVKVIFARRAVSTAQPSKCQICQCVSDDDGSGKPFCKPCETPRPQSLFRSADEDEEEATAALRKSSGRSVDRKLVHKH